MHLIGELEKENRRSLWRQMQTLLNFDVRSTFHPDKKIDLQLLPVRCLLAAAVDANSKHCQERSRRSTCNVLVVSPSIHSTINNHSICVHDTRTCIMMNHEQGGRQAKKK